MSTEQGPQHRTILRHTKTHLGSGPHANTARIAMARATVRLCACGCGQPIESPSARWRPGHWKPAPHEARVCIACGRTFSVPATSPRTVCTKNRNCQGSPVWSAEQGKVMQIRDVYLRTYLRGLRSSWTRDEQRVMLARARAYKQKYWLRDEPVRRAERDAVMRRMDATLRQNELEKTRQTDAWLDGLSGDDRRVAIDLLKDQEKDERRLKIQFEESLDEVFEDGNPKAQRLGTVYFDREEDKWPYIAERSRRRNIRRITRRRFTAGDKEYLAAAKEGDSRKRLRRYAAS